MSSIPTNYLQRQHVRYGRFGKYPPSYNGWWMLIVLLIATVLFVLVPHWKEILP